MSRILVHATSVLAGGASLPFGAYGEGAVLLLGKSGAGKSDVAVRLIAMGAKLIADDQTVLRVENKRLVAAAPLAIRGQLEIRNVGIVELEAAQAATVLFAVHLDPDTAPPRLPEPETYALPAGLPPCAPIPLVRLKPFEASTPAKIAATAAAILNGSFVAGAITPLRAPFL